MTVIQKFRITPIWDQKQPSRKTRKICKVWLGNRPKTRTTALGISYSTADYASALGQVKRGWPRVKQWCLSYSERTADVHTSSITPPVGKPMMNFKCLKQEKDPNTIYLTISTYKADWNQGRVLEVLKAWTLSSHHTIVSILGKNGTPSQFFFPYRTSLYRPGPDGVHRGSPGLDLTLEWQDIMTII